MQNRKKWKNVFFFHLYGIIFLIKSKRLLKKEYLRHLGELQDISFLSSMNIGLVHKLKFPLRILRFVIINVNLLYIYITICR